MLSKSDKKEIKNLRKQKNYLEIYNKYGQQGMDYVSSNVRRKLKNQLIKIGDIDTFQEIYKPITTRNAVKKVYDLDVLKNSKNKVIGSTKYLGLRTIHGLPKTIFYESLVFLLSLNMAAVGLRESSYKGSRETYATEIETYNEAVLEYTDYIKNQVNEENLDNLELIIKLATDMWENIRGYKPADLETPGYYEVGLMDSNATGVCRNFAADMVRKMNLINPDFHARTFCCKINDTNIEIMDNIITEDNILIDEDEGFPVDEEQKENIISKYFNKHLLADHAVVIFNMPGEEYPFIFDPTNPSLGIIANGKIILFNSLNEDMLYSNNYLYRPFVDVIFSRESDKTMKEMLISKNISTKKFIELDQKYGLEAQNKAVIRLSEIDDQSYIQEQFYTRKKN